MNILKKAFLIMLSIVIVSCSSDDDTTENLSGQKGELVLKFDNGVGDRDFIFGTSYPKSNGESFKLETLKYLISNISLKDSNGKTFMYPTKNNVFIVDETNGNNAGEIWITLKNVDAADYTSISFGVGIDQERYALGADGQGDFLQIAQDAGMLWSWATGFRFVRLDGTFSSSTVKDQPLNIHMGSVGTALDNYREVQLALPNSVRVRTGMAPQIHIKADISKIFDGKTSVNFMDGYDQVHTDTEKTPVIADNMMQMFQAHHVHNN